MQIMLIRLELDCKKQKLLECSEYVDFYVNMWIGFFFFVNISMCHTELERKLCVFV